MSFSQVLIPNFSTFKRNLVSVIVFSLCLACSESDTETDGKKSESKSSTTTQDMAADSWADVDASSNSVDDSLGYVADGVRGGYDLISALVPYDCLAYKVGDNAFVTTALCVAECLYEDDCDMALLTREDSPTYLGLMKTFTISNIYGGDLDKEIAIVYLDRLSTPSPGTIVAQSEGPVQQLGEERYMTSFQGHLGYIAPDDYVCDPATVAITNELGELIGLSLARRGQCNEFIYLNAFDEFLSQALEPGYEPERPRLEKPIDTSDSTAEMMDREAQESIWAEEEAAALMSAPACEDPGSSFCDGQVEVYCGYNGMYQALHCGRVGWFCRDSDIGGSCEPN